MEEERPTCPYCRAPMKKWMPPEDASWDALFQYVCFNDECSYYVEGWEWMKTKYEQKASYRHRYDPNTGESGPLPVWSPAALRDRIME